jgi:hypothetical protein
VFKPKNTENRHPSGVYIYNIRDRVKEAQNKPLLVKTEGLIMNSKFYYLGDV